MLEGDLTRCDIRRLVNRLCIAWMALGEILGLPADKIDEALQR